jgi:hypothetical protein
MPVPLWRAAKGIYFDSKHHGNCNLDRLKRRNPLLGKRRSETEWSQKKMYQEGNIAQLQMLFPLF